MRAQCPVVHSKQHGGYWIATSYRAVSELSLDPELFSSESISVPKDALGPDLAERPPITLDPPDHGPFRRTLLPAFGHRHIMELEPYVRQHARALAAAIATNEQCDAATDYAKLIPSRFMARMMGCAESQEEEFGEALRVILDSSDVEQIQEALVQTQTFLDDLIEQRRASPREDLVSCLLSAQVGGRDLTAKELTGALILIITAGVDTTWSAIGSSLWHLATHQDDLRRLVAEPDKIPVAVEEFLRAYPPVQVARVVTRDTRFHGVDLAAGDSILIGTPGANRDPGEFGDADQIVIDREINRHLTFGLGIHRCIGSSIARMEMRVALEEWLAVVPEFRLAEGESVTWSAGHVWGPRQLRLQLGSACASN